MNNLGIEITHHCGHGCSQKIVVPDDYGYSVLNTCDPQWLEPRLRSIVMMSIEHLSKNLNTPLLRARSNRKAIAGAVGNFLCLWKDTGISWKGRIEVRGLACLETVMEIIGTRISESHMLSLCEKFHVKHSHVNDAKKVLQAILTQYHSGWRPSESPRPDGPDKVLLQILRGGR